MSSLVGSSSETSNSTPINSIYNLKLRPVGKIQSITSVIIMKDIHEIAGNFLVSILFRTGHQITDAVVQY